MAFKISSAARNAMVDSLTALFNAGGAGYIQVRTGSPPTAPADADTGTLLATLTFSATSFGAGVAGVATANAITSDTSIDASGTAGHFRIKNNAGTCVAQGTVTATGNGGDMTFDSIAFVAGGTAAITSFTITQPES